LGDYEPCKIVGMGKAQIKLNNENQWSLKEVRHVPYFRRNLISIGQFGSEGCISTFIENVWKVTNGSMVMEKGEKLGTFYLCNGNVMSPLLENQQKFLLIPPCSISSPKLAMPHHFSILIPLKHINLCI
jgi:hypothetical protein